MTTQRARHVSVSIDCPPRRVYEYAANPENLPRWAAGLGTSVRRSPEGWTVETPAGPLGVRFAAPNDLGVLDHVVTLAPGVEVFVPMRVVPNGSGSEVIFTVFQRPDMSDAQLAEDAALVERDLRTLKRLLESAQG
jgi:hypothetical protein